MRTKDDEKREALFEAAVKTVNDIGFAASSVSKIAAEANVSPATLYVYFNNKEDLLVSTYLDIKRYLSRAILEDFEPDRPIRDILKNAWLNMFEYISNNLEYFRFTEQFANSPYIDRVDLNAVEHYFGPLIGVLQRGVEQKIIKNVDPEILKVFIFYPVMVLANSTKCRNLEWSQAHIETAFSMAWDAIKL